MQIEISDSQVVIDEAGEVIAEGVANDVTLESVDVQGHAGSAAVGGSAGGWWWETLLVAQQLAVEPDKPDKPAEESAPAAETAAPRTCLQGHELRPSWSTFPGTCDGCGVRVRRLASGMDCRSCNWYLCNACCPEPSVEAFSMTGQGASA